ncbi:hypothetical protein EMPS_02602 [Entomortierella parvispora]|uniref:Uncharacterized protein n=1 Tax=Entomortierella parvispora TaxID=205924 RepID=A0A9P3LTQ7_9FUNG|nr:hypothetical protein EMPS_02602 [Entomortierella parvispora]
MLQPATISAPASAASSPATPRAQRSSRKSGLTAALQSQHQNQHQVQNQGQGQGRTHSQQNGNNGRPNNSSNNGDKAGNSNNQSNSRQPRNPTKTHARHQSMPPQQRAANLLPSNNNSSGSNNNNSKAGSSITILKRSSASVVSPNALFLTAATQGSSKQSPTNQPGGQTSKAQPHNQKPRQQTNQNNSNSGLKLKRIQRRRENDTPAVVANTESKMNQSSLMNPSSPPSSTDSDDSESSATVSRSPLSIKNKPQPRSKGYGQLSCSPPQRPSSAPAVPQPRKGPLRTVDLNQANLLKNKGGLGNRKPSFGSSSTLSLDGAIASQFRPNVSKAVSADKIMLADRVCAEKNKLYAGPTFHNSPAPTSLPIPAFSLSLGGSPSDNSVETPSPPFFGEATSPQLNSTRQRTQSETAGWTSHHSMPGMLIHQTTTNDGFDYQLPDRITTSSYNVDEPLLLGSNQLLEISQNLRSLLKIQSQ